MFIKKKTCTLDSPHVLRSPVNEDLNTLHVLHRFGDSPNGFGPLHPRWTNPVNILVTYKEREVLTAIATA